MSTSREKQRLGLATRDRKDHEPGGCELREREMPAAAARPPATAPTSPPKLNEA